MWSKILKEIFQKFEFLRNFKIDDNMLSNIKPVHKTVTLIEKKNKLDSNENWVIYVNENYTVKEFVLCGIVR